MAVNIEFFIRITERIQQKIKNKGLYMEAKLEILSNAWAKFINKMYSSARDLKDKKGLELITNIMKIPKSV